MQKGPHSFPSTLGRNIHYSFFLYRWGSALSPPSDHYKQSCCDQCLSGCACKLPGHVCEGAITGWLLLVFVFSAALEGAEFFSKLVVITSARAHCPRPGWGFSAFILLSPSKWQASSSLRSSCPCCGISLMCSVCFPVCKDGHLFIGSQATWILLYWTAYPNLSVSFFKWLFHAQW